MMLVVRRSVAMNVSRTGVSNCAETPRVLRLTVAATILASCRRSCSTQPNKTMGCFSLDNDDEEEQNSMELVIESVHVNDFLVLDSPPVAGVLFSHP